MTEAHEVIEFDLSKELKEKLKGVFYDTDNKILNVYIKSEKSKPIKSMVDKSSMRNTLEQFNERVDGTLDKEIKLLCIYSIKYHLRKYVKFDDTEQKWYYVIKKYGLGSVLFLLVRPVRTFRSPFLR